MKIFSLPTDPLKSFKEFGFAVLQIYEEEQTQIMEKFAKNWVRELMPAKIKDENLNLEDYHRWPPNLGLDHKNIFCASRRHTSPAKDLEDILINKRLKEFLSNIGVDKFRIWNEGLGWLAFRFIRPGVGDGYPFTRKEWGVAKTVISAWLPVIGYSSSETLAILPGSHLKEYAKYLPTDHQFTKNEYRLAYSPSVAEIFRPNLKRGEVIFYHPRTIHSEEVKESPLTRLNLEFRIEPQ